MALIALQSAAHGLDRAYVLYIREERALTAPLAFTFKNRRARTEKKGWLMSHLSRVWSQISTVKLLCFICASRSCIHKAILTRLKQKFLIGRRIFKEQPLINVIVWWFNLICSDNWNVSILTKIKVDTFLTIQLIQNVLKSNKLLSNGLSCHLEPFNFLLRSLWSCKYFAFHILCFVRNNEQNKSS